MLGWLLAPLLLATSFTPLSPTDVTGSVLTLWSKLPQSQPLNQRVKQVAAALAKEPTFKLVESVDTDDDQLLDLILVAAPPPEREYETGPVQLYRGADLLAGKVTPHFLTNGPLFDKLQVADVNQDGRTEVVISTMPTGSGEVVTWLIYQWQSGAYHLIFDALVDSWTGPNELTIGPGTISVTCRPMEYYSHHTRPHRQQRDLWSWRNGAYHLTSHTAPPAQNAHQGVSDAEAYFRRQEYAKALPLYQQALNLPPEPEGRDWRPYIHLRLGQTLALLGRRAEAEAELKQAAQDPSMAGRAAALTLAAWSSPVPTALAAGLKATSPPIPPNPPYQLPNQADLAPPAVLLQAFLQGGGDWEKLQAAGLPFSEALSLDFDGDGQDEIWARMEKHLYNPASFLAVKGPEGWRVGDLEGYSVHPTALSVPGTKRMELHFSYLGVSPPTASISWDGRRVLRNPGGPMPLQPPVNPPCRQPIEWLR